MNIFDLAYNILALLILVIGLFVIYDNYRDRANIAFFWYAVGAFGWMISLYWGYYFADFADFPGALSWFRFAYAFSIFAMSCMTVFFYLFPKPSLKAWPVLIYLFYGVTALLFAASIFTPLIHESLQVEGGRYVGDNLGPLYSLYLVHIVMNLILSVVFAVHTYYKSQGIERSKIAYAIAGYVAFVFVAVLTNVVLPVFGIFVLQREVPILSFFFLVPAFIAVYRYRFFNFSSLSLNLLRKVILYGGFILLAILVLDASHSPERINLFSYSLGIIVTLLIYEMTSRSIPHFLPGNISELKKALQEFRSNIFNASTYEDIKRILDDIFILRLNFVAVNLYIVRMSGADIKLPVHKKNLFTGALEKLKRDMVVKNEVAFMKLGNGTKALLTGEMERMGVDLCVPLFSEKNLIGFLVLKHKRANHNFTKEELDEIASIKRPLEICLMNFLLKLNLEEENNLMKTIIDQKTTLLKKKIAEVNDLLKQQADFIAITAHEFRTPLSIATFQVENILHSSKPEKERLKDLKQVETSIVNLKNLIEKFFAVQQYDLDKVELKSEKTDITQFVKDVFKDFSPIMKERKIDFSLGLNSKKKLNAMIDESQFRQVLHNLLTNASKFTPEGGRVHLELLEQGKDLEVRIDDSGEGVPDALKKVIFEKFRTKSAGAGIGLGLYLCKKIVELHKGKIWVEDGELGGASFRLRLKMSR